MMIATDGQIIVIALVCLSLILLVLAGWLGRWPLWVAGWTVALIALAVVFFFRVPARDHQAEPEEETLIGMNSMMNIEAVRVMDPVTGPPS